MTRSLFFDITLVGRFKVYFEEMGIKFGNKIKSRLILIADIIWKNVIEKEVFETTKKL